MNQPETFQVASKLGYSATLKDQEMLDEFQSELYLQLKSLVAKHFPAAAALDETGTVNLDNRIWNNSKRFTQDFCEMVDIYQERNYR